MKNFLNQVRSVVTHPMVADLSGVAAVAMLVLAIVCLLNFEFLLSAAVLLASLCCAQLDWKSNQGGMISYFLKKR